MGDEFTRSRHGDHVKDESSSPEQTIDLDEDGDLIVARRTRLVGILIAHVAKTVFITDHGVEILDNCARNAHINSGLFGSESPVKVRELDWQKPWPPLDLDSGISVLQKMMCQHSKKVLYLALEKRYNFSLYDLDVVANGYSHFLSFLRNKKGFTGMRIDLSEIPQYYERGKDVELWEISYVEHKC